MMHTLKPAIALFAFATVIVAALSMVHSITLEPIAIQARNIREAAAREVLPLADEFEEIIEDNFSGVSRAFIGKHNGQVIGYAMEVFQTGYSGYIDVIVGISTENEAITGVRIIKHSETPGLGSLITRDIFYGQFENAEIITPFKVVQSSSNVVSEIDSVTGATISSVAVADAVNLAVEWYNENGGGSQ
jgi:electron transport complex protein RnfG